MRRVRKTSDILSLIIFGWCAVTLALNFLIPEQWLLDYDQLVVTDACFEKTHVITGTRWALLTMPAEGIDQTFRTDSQYPVDRVEWKGRYFRGETTSSWSYQHHLPPGEYFLQSSTLKVDFLYVFPVYISGVHSNTFRVIECDV